MTLSSAVLIPENSPQNSEHFTWRYCLITKDTVRAAGGRAAHGRVRVEEQGVRPPGLLGAPPPCAFPCSPTQTLSEAQHFGVWSFASVDGTDQYLVIGG